VQFSSTSLATTSSDRDNSAIDSLVQFHSHSQSGFDFVDLRATMRAILGVSSESEPDLILERLMASLLEVSSARRVVMVLRRKSLPQVVALADSSGVTLFDNPPTLHPFDGTPLQAQQAYANLSPDSPVAGLSYAPNR
jgi:hypothetical protein